MGKSNTVCKTNSTNITNTAAKVATDWKSLITTESKSILEGFAAGKISGRKATSCFKNTDYAGPFRDLVRSKGVDNARKLAKTALNRRSSKTA